MNFRIIVYILGWVLNMEAIFMLLPFAVGLFYRECAAYAFLTTALICAAAGVPAILRRPKNMVFYLKEGFVCRCAFLDCAQYLRLSAVYN